MFETIIIIDPQNFASDHFSLRSQLLQKTTLFYGGYLMGRQALALALDMVRKSLEDMMLKAQKEMEKPTPPLNHAPSPK